MKEANNLKIAVVSGASHALRYKDRNPRASEQEILQHVTDIADKIIKNIEEHEELD